MIYKKKKKTIYSAPFDIGDKVICINKRIIEYLSTGTIVDLDLIIATVKYDHPRKISEYLCIPYQGTLYFSDIRLLNNYPKYLQKD